MKKVILIVFLLQLPLCFSVYGLPDEGMWIPMLLEKYNIDIMREKGFRLSADDIYSVNRACMKDAVLMFGGGCTGAVISSEGLLITNHHCGYGHIQRLSTVEHDYLANGFWAMSREEELRCPGLSVTFLKRMEDVTMEILKGIKEEMSPEAKEKVMESNSSEIRRLAVEGTHYSAAVRPFYMGNQYFLFVYETFNDVRFVGAPPSSIGKFGGETDNWVWPRHTGDFSIFRIYAGTDNKPAGYSRDNVPYKPLYHFPVSLKGVKEGDFTMVFGYPGTTYQYVPSCHIDMVKNYLNPKMIEIRGKKIEIMEAAMNTTPLLRLQYSAKKSGIANGWKKWIGENQGLERMGTIGKKKEYEKRLMEWVNADTDRKAEYGNILERYEDLYSKLKEYTLVNNYTSDAFYSYGAEAVGFARNMIAFAGMFENNSEREKIEAVRSEMIEGAKGFFKNYDAGTDKKLFITVMNLYGKNLEPQWQSEEYIRLKNACKGNFSILADRIYDKSIFSDEQKYIAFVRSFKESDLRKLKKDPLYNLAKSTASLISEKVRGELNAISAEIRDLNKDYMALQMEYDSNRVFYPDANSTLRVSYGTVQGYYSRDAVYFNYFTTLKGIIEKDDPEIFDYDVPDRLKELYERKDFGPYSTDGKLPVCFIANNHTTGGNSGSPVINAYGHLTGINFDRAWEGVASDMAFNPEQSRNISLDIRFALFIIDKFAGAGYLLKEMTIVE